MEGGKTSGLNTVCNMNPTFLTILLSFPMSQIQHEDDLENIPSNETQCFGATFILHGSHVCFAQEMNLYRSIRKAQEAESCDKECLSARYEIKASGISP